MELDLAALPIGVVSRNQDVSRALTNNNTTMKQLIRLLKKHCVLDKDLQTSDFTMQLEFDYKDHAKPPGIMATG